MPQGGPLDKLDDRDLIVLRMIACGVPNRQIAGALGINENRIATMRHSPMARAALPGIRRDVAVSMTREVTERLAAEAMPTLDRLCTLRDQEENLPTALGAANALFDRQVPKVTIADVRNEHVIRFDGTFLRGAGAVLAEMGDEGVIDVTPSAARAMPRGAMLAAVSDNGETP